MARKNHNALKGVSRGKRYNRFATPQYATYLHPNGAPADLVRVIRQTSSGDLLVELDTGDAVRVPSERVIL